MYDKKTFLIDVTSKVFIIIILTLFLIAFVLAYFIYINTKESEWTFSIEYLHKEDILTTKADTIDCFREFIDESGRTKYSCIVGKKIK